MAKRKMRNDSGVTLLELMFASGVLALGLAMLFGSLISINVLGEMSGDRASATVQVAGILEHIRTITYSDLLDYQLPYEPAGPGVERVVLVECFDEEGGALPLPFPQTEESTGVLPILPNPLEVKVTMAWAGGNGRPYSVSAATRVGR